MPFSTTSLRRLLVSCSVAAALLTAASGCRSAHSAYQFRPATTVAVAPRQAAPAATPPAAVPATVAGAATAPPPKAAAKQVATRPARQPARRLRRPATPQPIQRLASAGRPAHAAVWQPARRATTASDGAQATAEVGLGTTVLGVLGLIVGPISLIGLLIWGGPVWAVLLGLSALAVLVAYIDPFR
ncbi:hypothetical protein [Hymenobacter aerophilus]|uniref:hypothetical protein n=1 Tax=Hymenobacter aerophilus TaxID=119644 RepID=UPI000375B651|nr:hypothetical protein [Hymenobacter aerophilus]